MDKKALLRRISSTLAKKLSVKQVYLFGSRARGTYHAESDYDIAVISRNFDGMSFIERQLLVKPLIRKVLGAVPLDVACYTPEEYEYGKAAFLPSVIEREGITV